MGCRPQVEPPCSRPADLYSLPLHFEVVKSIWKYKYLEAIFYTESDTKWVGLCMAWRGASCVLLRAKDSFLWKPILQPALYSVTRHQPINIDQNWKRWFSTWKLDIWKRALDWRIYALRLSSCWSEESIFWYAAFSWANIVRNGPIVTWIFQLCDVLLCIFCGDCEMLWEVDR